MIFLTLPCHLATSSHSAKIFYKEARKPRTTGKKSWLPGFLIKLALGAALPRYALSETRHLRGAFGLRVLEHRFGRRVGFWFVKSFIPRRSDLGFPFRRLEVDFLPKPDLNT